MKYRPSIIVASMPPLETGGGGWLLGILLRKRLIIDYMDDWESSMKEQLTRYVPSVVMMPAFEFARSIYKTCDGILAATPTLVRRLYQRRVDKQTILVPNGADTEIFSPKDETSRKKIKLNYSLPLSKMVVAYCGSTNTYYRLDLLLISIKSLPNHVKEKMFFVFYLYGDIDRFRRLKNHLGIPDEVLEIRGALPRKALSEVLAGCDVGLVPFDDMPFLLYAMSTKLFEYLSAGVYVVSSGPKGGELDSFFSKNTNCGVFVEPTATDYADTFLEIAESGEDLFDGDNRELRHLFIEENFDSRKIMLYAMDRLSNLEGASKCRA
jgi:glycosyltransferase involved in cell wall biosynthesis